MKYWISEEIKYSVAYYFYPEGIINESKDFH